MFDDITKALTIQISADDLTGGAWSSIGKGAKDLLNIATPLNQAWELTSKVISGVSDAMEKPIQWLSEGGEFAEAQAGLDALAKSYKVNGPEILSIIREMSDGSLDLTQATKAASDAIKKGFSDEQVAVIWSFAQKYVDTMGDRNGGVLDVANKIQDAIFTGKGKGAKDFGLSIAVGTEFAAIEKQMESLTKKMGAGAFNFGEELDKMGVSTKDSTLSIKRELNNLVGKEGFGGFADGVRAELRTIETSAPEIAVAIFRPFMDGLDAAWTPIRDFFYLVGEQIGVTFENTDTLGTKILTVFSTIANTGYDLAEGLGYAWNALFTMSEKAFQSLLAINGGLLEARLAAAEWMGSSAEDIAKIKEYIDTNQNLMDGHIITIDLEAIAKKQEEYNASILRAGDAHKELKLRTAESSLGITKAGEAFDLATTKQQKAKKTTDEHREATKLLVEDTKALGDAYSKMGDNLGNSVKVIGDVLNLTQTGINEVAAIGAKAIAESDPFGLGTSEKQRGIQSYLDKLRSDKDEEREILKEQAAAQRELAKSMDRFATTPRKVEHNVSGGDPLSALAISIIKTLNDMAMVEGTEVLGR